MHVQRTGLEKVEGGACPCDRANVSQQPVSQPRTNPADLIATSLTAKAWVLGQGFQALCLVQKKTVMVKPLQSRFLHTVSEPVPTGKRWFAFVDNFLTSVSQLSLAEWSARWVDKVSPSSGRQQSAVWRWRA